MTAKAKTLALAQRLGAKVEAGPEGHSFVIRVEAPQGRHWIEGYVHEIVAEQHSGPWSTRPLWADVHSRMLHGTEPCNGDCEWWDDES